MDFPTLRSMMRNVCGIGYVKEWPSEEAAKAQRADEPLPVTVVGTGFLVQPNIVLTARHVMDELVETQYNRGRVQIPKDRVVFVFTDYFPQETAFHILRGFRGFAFITSEEDAASKSAETDYAWLELKERYPARGLVQPPVGITVLEPQFVHVSQSVVVPGY